MKRKWNLKNVLFKKNQVNDERFEQLLAEVGEVLYKRLCQHVEKISTESALSELGPTKLKKAVNS